MVYPVDLIGLTGNETHSKFGHCLTHLCQRDALSEITRFLRQEGIQVGIQEGEQKGEAKMLVRQLQRRFGNVPEWANEKIAKADLSSLEEWSLRILDAPTLESVLADLS
ncbi:MAG: DUF4351 domain-containing protein [Magnetococcales bacterium]|nr:DUF4351 domain-containing protein [Magnetococcales bacterium]